ncbi:MAG: DMT family transporter [Bdellovibrio sp.]|nr:DMT family transporter [Bdellovibrio sp.]
MLHTLLYFLALLCLSTSPNWAKLNQMPVEVLGFWRLFIASIILGVWVFIWKRRTWPPLNKKITWVIVSGVFFFLHLWTYKFASKSTSVANTMILFASAPLWSSAGAILFFKEKMTLRLGIAYGIAVVGIYLLAFEHIEFNSFTFLGDLSAVISGFFYACYMLTGKKARLHYDNSIYSFLQYGVCALLFAANAIGMGKPFLGYSDVSWFAVMGLVLLPTLLGHLTLTYLVNYMNLSLMSCGKLIEPVIASIIAYFVFHEMLKPEAWVAFGLTSVSVIILFTPSLLEAKKRQTLKR